MPLPIIYVNEAGIVYENQGPHPEPYVNKKGETVTLNRWMAYCRYCGEPFEVLFTARLNPWKGFDGAMNRTNCPEHKNRKIGAP